MTIILQADRTTLSNLCLATEAVSINIFDGFKKSLISLLFKYEANNPVWDAANLRPVEMKLNAKSKEL